MVAAAILITAFMAFFMGSIDSAGNFYDGLGRELVTKPSILQNLFGQEKWAGLGWRIADVVWFFGGFYVAMRLFDYSSKD